VRVTNHMPVDSECDPRIGVTEPCLCNGKRRAAGEKQASVSVTESVKAAARNLQRIENWNEMVPNDVLCDEEAATRIDEEKFLSGFQVDDVSPHNGCGRWPRGTRAGRRHRDTGSSAIRKSARATSPESAYSQRCPATCGGGPADTSLVARPSPKLDDPHHGRDRPDAKQIPKKRTNGKDDSL
jgi:hypothetical protein